MTVSRPSPRNIGSEMSCSSLRFGVKPLVMVCAWCKNVRAANGNWQRVKRHHVRDDNNGRTSHGMCPACAYSFTLELDLARAQAA